MKRTAGERILFWALPAVAIIWIAAFFLFPGFLPPMSPEWSAQKVAAFYANHTSRVRYSMVLFNWFCVALIPILMLIVERMRGMAHRTPILRYCVIGVAGAAPIAFLTATIFWLLAAFRPYRPPALTQLYNDLAWITFTCGVPFLVALCLFLAVAIYLDEQARPVFDAVGRPFQPSHRHRAGAGRVCRPDTHWTLRLEWLPVVLGQERRHRPLAHRHGNGVGTGARARSVGGASLGVKRPALLDDPKRELWLAWYATIGFYSLYTVVFFIITRTQPPGKPWYTPSQVVGWFASRHEGLLIGFALIFILGGLSATSIALITYSIRRMSVSRAFAYSYLILYAVSAVPGFLFICVAMTVGAFRPDRNPEILRWLYDLGFLSFSGTMGVFLIGSLIWMLAILLDKNRVFPVWFGYLNLCNGLTEVVVAPSWIFHAGVFAWNGVIAWWINVAVFGLYTGAFIFLLRNMILREDFGTGPLPDLPPEEGRGRILAEFMAP